DLLKTYEDTSGRKVNVDKTGAFLSPNTKQEVRNTTIHSIEVSNVREYNKYLGLPAYSGRSKASMFHLLKERVWGKLTGWKEKLLSNAGKQILIKAVAQSLPTYAMSVFKLPSSICNALNSIICNFWWGQTREKQQIHWLSWRQLCESKL
ncbi:hypothetical protein CFOL_v3_08828, partial [Cephalotus follicularis]